MRVRRRRRSGLHTNSNNPTLKGGEKCDRGPLYFPCFSDSFRRQSTCSSYREKTKLTIGGSGPPVCYMLQLPGTGTVAELARKAEGYTTEKESVCVSVSFAKSILHHIVLSGRE